MYVYRFYRFDNHSAYAAAWASAGLTLRESGEPVLTSGAIDEIGAVTDSEGAAIPGWHVNVAWSNAAPGALETYSIAPFEGLRAFAGWSNATPPSPVPEQVDNSQVRILLIRLGLFDAVNTALHAQGGEALQLWEYANKINRYNSPLVAQVASGFGFDEESLDNLFRRAAEISG